MTSAFVFVTSPRMVTGALGSAAGVAGGVVTGDEQGSAGPVGDRSPRVMAPTAPRLRPSARIGMAMMVGMSRYLAGNVHAGRWRVRAVRSRTSWM